MPSNADRNVLSLAGAAGLGAAAMYFLDPARGSRRRHMLADQVAHTRRVVGEGIQAKSQDLRNRAVGMTARARRRFAADEADDEVVAERVRAKLGRAVSHPRAIDVSVTDGRVSLVGVVLSDEAERLLRRVRSVSGVHEVEDRLERHETADDIAGLQGSGSHVLRQPRSPTARLLTGVTGSALVLGGLARGGRAAWPVALTGLALLGRSVVNKPVLGGGTRVIRVSDAIEIGAPTDVVFDYVTDWERWPEWVPNVLLVKRFGREANGESDEQVEIGERTHWEVEIPDGASMAWDAVTTRFVESESVSWRSGEGAALHHAGSLHLVPRDGDATRLEIELTCRPVVDRVGDLVTAFFGREPERQTQIALETLKSVIETGAVPEEGAERESRGRAALRRWKARVGRP